LALHRLLLLESVLNSLEHLLVSVQRVDAVEPLVLALLVHDLQLALRRVALVVALPQSLVFLHDEALVVLLTEVLLE
jgi:hypothetical protein